MAATLAKIVSQLKPKRRWAQFGLGTLLLAVTVLCVWLALQVNRVQRQRNAIAVVERMGGQVYFDYQYPPRGPRDLDAPPPGPSWLRRMAGDGFFRTIECVSFFRVDFASASIGEADFRQLKQRLLALPEIRLLSFDRSRLTDTQFGSLEGLTNVRTLNIDGTEITDAGLRHLGGWSKLKGVVAYRTPGVTDAGMAKLQKSLNLERADR